MTDHVALIATEEPVAAVTPAEFAGLGRSSGQA